VLPVSRLTYRFSPAEFAASRLAILLSLLAAPACIYVSTLPILQKSVETKKLEGTPMKLSKVALCLSLLSTAAYAQVNIGTVKPDPNLPFTMTQVGTFNFPWRIAFLPDSRMLVTERVGPVWVVSPNGEKIQIQNTPPVLKKGLGGMLGVFLSPHYKTDHNVYLTFSEPDAGNADFAGLALGRGKLVLGKDSASLENFQVLWREYPKFDPKGGNFGAQVEFSPDGKYLFLSDGDHIRMSNAQDPNVAAGKILRLTLDGKPAPGNPDAGKVGTPTVQSIDIPKDTIEAQTPKVLGNVILPGPNLTPSETWATGFRSPYGLKFAPDGRLWEVENGPMGGDELNLIEPGKNYGWPLASYGLNYDSKLIPTPDTTPQFVQPVLYWKPVIAPGALTFYNGKMFPQWNGSALVAGLGSQSIHRITFDGKGGVTGAERWAMGHRIRDIEVAPDGALWMIEDTATGALWRVTPK
jgi:glucose/arabinose dehydrogenase